MVTLSKRLLPVLAFFAVLPLFAAQEPVNRNIRFGLPSPAKKDPAQLEDYLLERPQYVVSYNAKTKSPNWVAWCLQKEDIGKSQRGAFKQDGQLPAGFTQVTSAAYTGCGFDRGHMCPAQDRSSEQKDMDATFFMTNIVPQSPNSNRKGWERLEAYCRTLAKDHVLYIACGPHGVGGEGANGKADEIGSGKLTVTVPAKLWKVILVLPSATAEPRRNTRAIAVIMPNDQSVDYDWAKYRVSVAEVENLTGYRFFPTVQADVAEEIKKDVDAVKVKAPKSKSGSK